MRHVLRARRAQDRPHRHRHARRVRLADALRPGRGLPAGHHQEAAPASSIVHELLWFLRGETNVALPARARRHDLGRVGRRRRRARARCTACSGARWRGADGRTHRPDRGGGGPAAARPALAPHHRQRLERGRARPDGAHALPRDVPVLRRGRAAVLPALPAQRRHLPRRAVQHRLLRAAHAHDGAAVRPRAPASSSGRAATATSTSTTSSRRGCSSRASRCRCRTLVAQAPARLDLRLPLTRTSRSPATSHIPPSRLPSPYEEGQADPQDRCPTTPTCATPARVADDRRSPLFAVRRSRIHGSGVYAARRIRKGTRIVEYLGERISHAQGRRALRGQGPGRRPHVPVHRGPHAS